MGEGLRIRYIWRKSTNFWYNIQSNEHNHMCDWLHKMVVEVKIIIQTTTKSLITTLQVGNYNCSHNWTNIN